MWLCSHRCSPCSARPALAGSIRGRQRAGAGWSAARCCWPPCLPPSAWCNGKGLRVGGRMAVALLSGYMVLQYADVRSAYPAALTGRAMAAFTMALFLGVALMQWVTGIAASLAAARGIEPYAAVMLTIALMLVLGALAFKCLPAPAH